MKKRDYVYTIDDYACRSPFRNWNPALKAGTAMLVLVMGIGIPDPAVSYWMMFTGGLVAVLGCRMPVWDYLEFPKIPLLFILLGCAAIAVEIGLKDGLRLYLNRESMTETCHVALRTLGAVSVLYDLVLSTPVHEVAAVLRQLHAPKVVTELMILIYRYIFLPVEAQHTICQAAESRLGHYNFRASCRTFGNSMSSPLLVFMRKASRYYNAMLPRGYDGELLFWEEEKVVKARQVLCPAAYAVNLPLVKMIFSMLMGGHLTDWLRDGREGNYGKAALDGADLLFL